MRGGCAHYSRRNRLGALPGTPAARRYAVIPAPRPIVGASLPDRPAKQPPEQAVPATNPEGPHHPGLTVVTTVTSVTAAAAGRPVPVDEALGEYRLSRY